MVLPKFGHGQVARGTLALHCPVSAIRTPGANDGATLDAHPNGTLRDAPETVYSASRRAIAGSWLRRSLPASLRGNSSRCRKCLGALSQYMKHREYQAAIGLVVIYAILLAKFLFLK